MSHSFPSAFLESLFLWLSEFNSDLFLRKWKVSFSHRELRGSLGYSVYSLSETTFEPLGLDRVGGNT